MPRTPKTIRSVGEKSFSWHHINKPGERELQYLEEHYGFDALDLHDCLPSLQRPKLVVRDSYLFLILNLPYFDREARRLFTNEIDIFISKHGVVTLSTFPTVSLENFFELLETSAEHRASLLSNPGIFIEQLLDELLDECFPILLHISNDIESLNGSGIYNFTGATLEEIMRLKHNLITFQKAVQPHRDLLRRTETVLGRTVPATTKKPSSFDRLMSHCKEIWDNLEMYNRAIDAIQSTYMNASSLRLNETVRTLTVHLIWLTVLVVIAGYFGMELPGTPLLKHPNSFALIVGGSVAISVLILWLFKKRRWL